MTKWFLPIAALLILTLVLFGGYLVDAIVLNLNAVQSMKGKTGAAVDLAEGGKLTAWGICRQQHLIGREYLLNSQYDLALQPLQSGAECSDDPWVWYDLGQVQYALGDLEGAARSWRETPEGYNQAVLLAAATAEQGDLEATIAAWQFVSEVNPNKQSPYIQQARLYETVEPERVEPLLLQAVEADSNAPGAYIELGAYYLEIGDRIDAQDHFEQALALDPSNIHLLVTMANNAAELGNVPAAIDLWQEVALRNERRQGLAYYQIGNLAFGDGNFSSALAFYKRAVEIEPENGLFLLGLAGAYVEAGCRQQAITAYQDVIETADAEAVVAEAELQLAELAVINNELTPCLEEQ